MRFCTWSSRPSICFSCLTDFLWSDSKATVVPPSFARVLSSICLARSAALSPLSPSKKSLSNSAIRSLEFFSRLLRPLRAPATCACIVSAARGAPGSRRAVLPVDRPRDAPFTTYGGNGLCCRCTRIECGAKQSNNGSEETPVVSEETPVENAGSAY